MILILRDILDVLCMAILLALAIDFFCAFCSLNKFLAERQKKKTMAFQYAIVRVNTSVAPVSVVTLEAQKLLRLFS